jgi:hypothetical protein
MIAKYSLQVDRNRYRRRAPEDTQDTAFYGCIQFYFILDLPSCFPFKNSQRRPDGTQQRQLALALVSPAKLDGSARMPAYRSFATDEIVTIDSILGLVGRVWNQSKRRYIVVGRPEVMEQVDGATFTT